MRAVTLDGFYRTDEGPPAFVYDVELSDGFDTDGKFNIQFAALGNDAGETVFAVVIQGEPKPFVIDWTDATRTMVSDLIQHRQLFACLNYDNTGWEEHGGYSEVLLGRDFGQQFDVVQRLELADQDVAALREIRTVLDGDSQS